MSTVHESAQAAEDAMILNQSAVQLAQVKYNNSKVTDENALAIHFLHEFQKAFAHIKKLQATQQKNKDDAKEIQQILRVVAIIGAVIACVMGQPEIAALIILTTSLSMIPSGKKDKNGNSLSCMDVLVKGIAKNILGGDTPANEIWASVLIAVVLTVLTCGAGAGVAFATAAEDAGVAALSRAIAVAPLAIFASLGSSGFPQRVTAAIEANAQAMNNFTAFVDFFCAKGKGPSQAQIKCILSILITVAFLVVSIGAGLSSLKTLGTSSTVLSIIGSKILAYSSAAAISAEETAETASTVASTVGRESGTSAWCFADGADSAALTAAEEGTEMLEVASGGAVPVAGTAAEDARGVAQGAALAAGSARSSIESAAESVSSCVRGAARSAVNVVERAAARMAGFMRGFATWCYVHPLSAIGGIMVAAFMINNVVSISMHTALAANEIDQGELIIEQGSFGVKRTDASFHLKLINMIADQDSKALQTQWQADAALQQAYSEFSANTGSIADALLG